MLIQKTCSRYHTKVARRALVQARPYDQSDQLIVHPRRVSTAYGSPSTPFFTSCGTRAFGRAILSGSSVMGRCLLRVGGLFRSWYNRLGLVGSEMFCISFNPSLGNVRGSVHLWSCMFLGASAWISSTVATVLRCVHTRGDAA